MTELLASRLRPTLAPEWLAVAAAVYLTSCCNARFWSEFLAGRDVSAGTVALVLATFVLVTTLHALIILPFASRWLVKPAVTFLMLGSAAATYYMSEYGVYLDGSMMRNVLQTDASEVSELLGWGLAAHVLLVAGPPIVGVWVIRLPRRRWTRALARRTAVAIVCLAMACTAGGLFLGQYASFLRTRREARYLVTPANFVLSAFRVSLVAGRASAGPRVPVGTDAVRRVAPAVGARPKLFVFVVGETARAANFGLNGYARDTTPRLREAGVVCFRDVLACGTATADALPCMFSRFPRAEYDDEKGRRYESLLDVVQRAGFRVIWIDNNTGCKGTCAGVETLEVDAALPACSGGECLDQGLLETAKPHLDPARGDLVLVLHQKGEHGPAYFRRYPPAFERFSPVCRSEDFDDCTDAEIRNAYDNAVSYTDHVLGETIAFLRSVEPIYDTGLLYVSDHGESLGENGMYLHGLPYRIAPDVQKKVPMVVWLSPGFAASTGVDVERLREVAARPHSHDNVFHSVLGILDIRTSVYEPGLDFFRPARAAERSDDPTALASATSSSS